MRQPGWGLTPAFVMALALAATAQEKPVTTNKDMTDTVKVTVTGHLELDYVWRSKELEQFVDTDGTQGTTESENTFEGYVAVRFNVELSDKVSAVVEVGTVRVDDGFIEAWGQPEADGTSIDLFLREAHVQLGDFLTNGVTAQFGITTWSFDVRGRGSAFVFDPRHSQSFVRNASVTADGSIGSNAPEELAPVGGVFTYTREQLQVELVLLPAVIEQGPASADEALYAIDLYYKLDNARSRVGAIIALVAMPDPDFAGPAGGGGGTTVFTIGGGATLMGLVPNLELYGEIYFQFGDVARDVDAGGFAFQLGGEYTLDPNGIRLGANLTWISGDDDTTVTDDTNDAFLSYENVNDLLIIESMYFGVDWDSNYFAVKFKGELPLDVKAKGDLVLSVILGITRTAEDVEFGGGVSEDALGNEIDFKARWAVTKQAALHAAIGLLFGSDVLEESFVPGGANHDDADDSAILFVLGAELNF
ncbi:MAG TPA: hypothetical protein VEJ18_14485 [Planctomycetota bacterium]|nr:hypothetical protein [Planctomycetota bacterium]